MTRRPISDEFDCDYLRDAGEIASKSCPQWEGSSSMKKERGRGREGDSRTATRKARKRNLPHARQTFCFTPRFRGNFSKGVGCGIVHADKTRESRRASTNQLLQTAQAKREESRQLTYTS